MQKVFWAQGCKAGLHWCKTGFRWCKRRSGDFSFLTPKDLLHPLLTTFGLSFSGPVLEPSDCKVWMENFPSAPQTRTRSPRNRLKSRRNSGPNLCSLTPGMRHMNCLLGAGLEGLGWGKLSAASYDVSHSLWGCCFFHSWEKVVGARPRGHATTRLLERVLHATARFSDKVLL